MPEKICTMPLPVWGRHVGYDDIDKKTLLSKLKTHTFSHETARPGGSVIVSTLDQALYEQVFAALDAGELTEERLGDHLPLARELQELAVRGKWQDYLLRATDMLYQTSQEIPLYDLNKHGQIHILRVGRLDENDIQVRSPTVSREHALLARHGGRAVYIDLAPDRSFQGSLEFYARQLHGTRTFLDGSNNVGLGKRSPVPYLPTQHFSQTLLRALPKQ